MRKKLTISLAIFMICAMIITSLSGCGQQAKNGMNNDQPGNEQKVPAETEKETENLPPEELWFGKYDPPIEMTAVRGIPAGSQEANFSDNLWIREYEEKLGIKLKYEWMVIGDQYEQKVNLMLATGDLPDVFTVNLRQLYQLQEAGLIQDLTNVWNKYASEQTKTVMTMGGTSSFDIATIDGKLYGIPAVVPPLETMHVLYVREDWRKKLGLPEPNTIEDMEKIMYAFYENDPNGNNKKDEFGLGLNKDLFTN